MHVHNAVKVYRTKCPELNTPGPTWYKIEAFIKDEKKTVGNFKDFAYPILEEISLTHDKTVSFEFYKINLKLIFILIDYY